MRGALRSYVGRGRPTHFSKTDTDAMYRWLRRNFVLPLVPGGGNRPHVIRVYFPVGRPCTEDSSACAAELSALLAEAREFGDLVVGDYPDTLEMQGAKYLSTLSWLDTCRAAGSKWQWSLRLEPYMVVNIPNIAYYLRHLDTQFLKAHAAALEDGHDPPRHGELLDVKVLEEKRVRSLKHYPKAVVEWWWSGQVMSGVPVLRGPADHPNAEPNFAEDVYPDYISKRFLLLNRRVVARLVEQYERDGILYRNDDAAIGILAAKLPEASRLKPKAIAGVSIMTDHTDVIRDICGPDFDLASSFEKRTLQKKEVQQVESLLECDCSTWLAYRATEANDLREILRDLADTCPFADKFATGEVFWLKKK